MAKPELLVVGWLGEVNRPELWNPQAPKSYTKPESIDLWQAEARANQALAPFVGRVSSLVLLDHEGEVFVDTDELDDVSMQSALTCLGAHLRSDDVLVAGFNIRTFFRTLVAEAWRMNITPPHFVWHETPNLIDMYDDIVPGREQSKGRSDIPADLKNGFGLGSLFEYFHGHPALSEPDVTRTPMTAMQMARTAYALAKITGLV